MKHIQGADYIMSYQSQPVVMTMHKYQVGTEWLLWHDDITLIGLPV